MSKNSTNNRISYGQYKAADIFLFLLIMCVCEIVNVLAVRSWFSGAAMFSISVMLLVSLVVLIRWNWLGIVFPMVDGVLYCWLCGAGWQTYIIYIFGNAFVALAGLLFLIIPKEKVVGKWLLTAAYALLGFVLLVLGRSLMSLFFGETFLAAMLSTIQVELMNLVFAFCGLLVLRLADSMLVDQKKYLIKVTEERDTIKPAEAEYYWNGYAELNEDDLQKLKAMDEYDKKITFNHSTLKALKENSGEDAIPDYSGGDIYDDLAGTSQNTESGAGEDIEDISDEDIEDIEEAEFDTSGDDDELSELSKLDRGE